MSKETSEYEKNLIKMQFQMRENQSYMSDAFADLDNWSKEMKVKEKEIIENPSLVKTSNKVRNIKQNPILELKSLIYYLFLARAYLLLEL